MIWHTPQDIRWLQVEITSLCQAGCIDCNRWRPQDDKWVLNGVHPHFNKYYDYDKFVDHINQFTNLKSLQFCGNVGDPMAHPRIADCVKAVLDVNDNCDIDISTNGAIGTLEQYSRIGQLCNDFNVSITFAIDGLEDTNHIYRRGVSWKDIMTRAKTFISSGGRAQWMWIDFPHSRHQINDAKKLAKDIGFVLFETRQRFTQTEKFDNEIIRQSTQPVIRSEFHSETPQPIAELEQQYMESIEKFVIENYKVDPGCVSKSNKRFHHPCPHLNVDGTLWPCCFTANGHYHINPAIRHWWNELDQKYGLHWNNLNHHPLDDILNTNFFMTDLEDSWQGKNLICYQQCGKCKD